MKVCPNCGKELVIGTECFIHTKESILKNEINTGIAIKIADCEKCEVGYIC